MNAGLVIFFSVLYICLLFMVAYYADKKANIGKSIINNPYVYALSLAVYCTAWTFFGSVGRGATTGLAFLPTYLGPTLIAPLWIIILRKIIIISKSQNINSIADFISSRYGKSTSLGAIATLIAVIGIIPYISIQLKAINLSFDVLITEDNFWGNFFDGSIFYRDNALLVSLVLAIFTILFGTRKLNPNERHEGLIAAVAFESIIKIVTFLAVGIYVTYGIYNGFEDIFSQAANYENLQHIFSLEAAGVSHFSWMIHILLSMLAVMFLPRQFHIAVVENTNPNFVYQAAWLFPLYLFLINIFVLPIALGGMMHFGFAGVEPDSFVLDLPKAYDANFLAMMVYIGGFAAASGMVIVAVISLSIMISNNLVTPLLLQSSIIKEKSIKDLSQRLLGIRRVTIVIVLILAYAYFKAVSKDYSLVSIGLISFTAVAQFAPVMIGGIFWKRATKEGAITALLFGFLIWAYTLTLPTLAETGIIASDFVKEGLFGWGILKPYALFGLEGLDKISHAAFWSLFFNIGAYVLVSLNTKPSSLEISQANLFVDIYKYENHIGELDPSNRRARMSDIIALLNRFLGVEKATHLFQEYEKSHHLKLQNISIANAELINYVEGHLSGALGTASAKVVIGSIIKEDPISLEEMLKILDETQEIVQYSKALEKKSQELEETTQQLQKANDQLKELDHLKADFITTVTHELRTPITSIRSLAKILADNPTLKSEQQEKFLHIIVSESERISRLINQVLDVEKIQAANDKWPMKRIDLSHILEKTYQGFVQIMAEKGLEHQLNIQKPLYIKGNTDKITQVIVNLGANAIKFSETGGQILFSLTKEEEMAVLKIKDTGIGISKKDQQLIFEKFRQVNNETRGKPTGSGLGLFITKKIVERHRGTITLESEWGKGATFIVKIPLV